MEDSESAATHSLTPSLSHPLPSFWLSDCCPLDLHLLLFYSSHQTFTVIRAMESLTQGFKDSRRFICHIHLSYSEVWSLCRSVDCSKNPASDLTVRLTHSPLSTCVAYRFWIDLFFLLSVTVEMFLRVPIVDVQFPPPRSVASAWHRMMIKCDFNLDPQHRTASPAGRKTLI